MEAIHKIETLLYYFQWLLVLFRSKKKEIRIEWFILGIKITIKGILVTKPIGLD